MEGSIGQVVLECTWLRAVARRKGCFGQGFVEVVSGGPINSRRYSNPTALEPYHKNIAGAANRASSTDVLGCIREVPVNVFSSVFNNSTAASASFEAQIDGDFVHE